VSNQADEENHDGPYLGDMDASPTNGSDDQPIKARLTILEQQHQRLIDDNANILAEVRGLREDFREHMGTFASEMSRLYDVVVGLSKDTKKGTAI